ncbi:histone-lysine N-methyltransferase, H3 lysine-9 specific, putative [Trichomonas vaginalis G3]|uniref:Histone-lysine N-methyltransferase, H3 lysine-9 specific, putative n=1 Tax=Trichomonas vaginalis (strain ATCC PRA-98 / G3) TaxID=412133 RepID=A2D741_TRIV3|nr:protein ubiquitination [Trichomonas vaginalis G3]EAY23558.1 histone-lysine N-methyltransferase, H3 lysine-9 specific, putative [Trichomonas vaginalis G3]KAI5490056.1 protein ubiquitination [Trichomonas vaginalis G3]|eukprot:XP_001276806.1 histone-lysine N-methyltransferase, H3 lysine-9 specific [Trichomonas vaginalis G3]
MKFTNLTTNDFITLLKQSQSIVKANELYTCIRNANVSIQNYEDVINILKSSKKYLKLAFLDGIIDFLIQSTKEQSDYTKKIQTLQAELKTIQELKQKSDKQVESLNSQLNQIYNDANYGENFISKISELKKSNDFERIYKFFEALSSQGNHKKISKSCKEGLWLIEAPKSKNGDEKINILHAACENGNLRLVKSLIECGCDKESPSQHKNTPLEHASLNGKLEVVKYHISIGANRDARSDDGWTPLIFASRYGYLEVVKYLISVGANKEGSNDYGWTPPIFASANGQLEVVKYLISVGANKEAKTNSGYTPLILASRYGYLEVVIYLISIGADKEAKNKDGKTCFDLGNSEIREYISSI